MVEGESSLLFTSYATEGTPYVAEADRLCESLDRFGFDLDLRHRPNLGTWKKNCFQKIDHLIEIVQEYTDRPIVWLDADAEIVREPAVLLELQEEDVSFAAARRYRGSQLLSGTLYFGRDPKRLDFLQEVRAAINDHPRRYRGDQQYVHLVNERWCGDDGRTWNFIELPIEYCAVFWRRRIHQPVIRQHQASRRFRRIVAENHKIDGTQEGGNSTSHS